MSDPRDVSEPQERAEALDEDKLGGPYPPDRPQAVEDPWVITQGEWLPESLEDRVHREHPEHLAGPDDDPHPDPDGCDVYAYFNNDTDGHAPLDATWLRDRLLR
jgi:hypothetical protein